MKLSVRNVLKGKVVKVTAGAVNSEVIIGLLGGMRVVSIITKTSARPYAFRLARFALVLQNGILHHPISLTSSWKTLAGAH